MNPLHHREQAQPPTEWIAGAEDRAEFKRAVIAYKVTKVFDAESVKIKAVDDITFRLAAGERMGILGGNGAGKSTLIKLIAGVLVPSSGQIHLGLSVSWPLAIGGGFFDGHLTGYDTVRFLCRLYKLPFAETYDYVIDFSELTKIQMNTPVRFYSSGMNARLAFSLSLAVDFECLLIDEVIVVGDRRFQEKCLYEVFDRRKDRAIILAVHSPDVISQYCSRVLLMKNGRGRVFDDLEMATRIYHSL